MIRQLREENKEWKAKLQSKSAPDLQLGSVQAVRATQHWINSQQVSSLVSGPISTATRRRPRAITRQPHREGISAPTSPDPISAYYRRFQLSPHPSLTYTGIFPSLLPIGSIPRFTSITCFTICSTAFSSKWCRSLFEPHHRLRDPHGRDRLYQVRLLTG